MIIAISGKARSGKTEAARAICKQWPEFSILSFAAPLKQIAMDHFDLTKEDIENKDKTIELSGNKITIRELLIEIGLMYRRIDPDFWVKRLWKQAPALLEQGRSIVIDDMRFMNEAKFLSDKGAKLIRIERPGVRLINDPSETELDNYAFKNLIINHYATIAEYHNQVCMAHSLGACFSCPVEAPLP